MLLICLSTATGTQQNPAIAERQVVLETTVGEIVIELFPEAAPEHVLKFQQRIRQGFYEKTTFHRAISYGIIQGGDPISRDPQRWGQYGTGGLMELAAEFNEIPHTRGTLSAVLVPGNPDSAGSQFFICVTDQTQLDGQYTAFGRVVDGLKVVEQISALQTDENQRLRERVEIVRTLERDRPPPEVIPFVETTPEELAIYEVRIVTNLGDMRLAFFPDDAPRHVRQFLRFAKLGLYDGTTFHRVVPEFVVQGGSLANRKEKIPEKYQKLVKPIPGEFNDRKHLRGIVSMARSEDPNSGLDSFFIVLGPQEALDGQYSVFGEVIEGIDTVDGISQVPTQGESPMVPVLIERMEVIEVESSEK
jgi:cyclophilin family peptidyl-prolyl cis-trans isomerase